MNQNERTGKRCINTSNVTGWNKSPTEQEDANEQKASVEIHRNTEQGIIIIIYNTSESTHGKFKNTLIQLSRVIYAYGHGSFFGMAEEGSIECIEGFWSPHCSLGCLSFDHVEEAIKCIQAKTPLREWSWLGGVEMYIVPICNPLKSCRNYPIFQIDLYDIKNRVNFEAYVRQVVPLVMQNHGLVVSGTEQIERCRGIRSPQYIILIQWVAIDNFRNYDKEARILLRDSGAACASRIIFHMTVATEEW